MSPLRVVRNLNDLTFGASSPALEPWCATCASSGRSQPPTCAIRMFACSACGTRIGFCVGCIERGWPVAAMHGHRAAMAGEPPDSPYHGCARAVLEPISSEVAHA
jgi:hypothetical protein